MSCHLILPKGYEDSLEKVGTRQKMVSTKHCQHTVTSFSNCYMNFTSIKHTKGDTEVHIFDDSTYVKLCNSQNIVTLVSLGASRGVEMCFLVQVLQTQGYIHYEKLSELFINNKLDYFLVYTLYSTNNFKTTIQISQNKTTKVFKDCYNCESNQSFCSK